MGKYKMQASLTMKAGKIQNASFFYTEKLWKYNLKASLTLQG